MGRKGLGVCAPVVGGGLRGWERVGLGLRKGKERITPAVYLVA